MDNKCVAHVYLQKKIFQLLSVILTKFYM